MSDALVGVGVGDAEGGAEALQQVEVEAGDLGDLARRVAGAVAGQGALDRQQRQPPGGDRVAQFLQRDAVGGELLRAAPAAPRAPRPRRPSSRPSASKSITRPPPLPPRRGIARRRSSAAASARSRATACTPPKKRLIAGRRATGVPRASSRASASSSMPGLGLDDALPRSAAAAPAPPRRRPSPARPTRTIVCRIAERIRFEPALPSPSSISPSRRTTVGAIIEGPAAPAGCGGSRAG